MNLSHVEVNESKIKVDKMRQFGEHVRENFIPQVDEGKRMEIERQIEEEGERRRRGEKRG